MLIVCYQGQDGTGLVVLLADLHIDRPAGLLERVTVPYAACIQICPPEDEHLMLETCRGE